MPPFYKPREHMMKINQWEVISGAPNAIETEPNDNANSDKAGLVTKICEIKGETGLLNHFGVLASTVLLYQLRFQLEHPSSYSM